MAGCRANLEVYRENARMIAGTLDELGIWYVGGINSPYIWMQCPNGMTSWEFFDFLLEKATLWVRPAVIWAKTAKAFSA